MSFRMQRLSAGEWALLIGGTGMLVDLFVSGWDGYREPGTHLPGAAQTLLSRTGWQALGYLAPGALVVSVLCLAIWWLTATRRSPAVPTVLTTLLLPLACLLTLLVANRILLDPPQIAAPPSPGDLSTPSLRAGAYVGLAFSLLMSLGLYTSLRRERDPAPAPEIQTVTLQPAERRDAP